MTTESQSAIVPCITTIYVDLLPAFARLFLFDWLRLTACTRGVFVRIIVSGKRPVTTGICVQCCNMQHAAVA
eukprot:3750832-Pleurochrysis_carterae.AAC.3